MISVSRFNDSLTSLSFTNTLLWDLSFEFDTLNEFETDTESVFLLLYPPFFEFLEFLEFLDPRDSRFVGRGFRFVELFTSDRLRVRERSFTVFKDGYSDYVTGGFLLRLEIGDLEDFCEIGLFDFFCDLDLASFYSALFLSDLENYANSDSSCLTLNTIFFYLFVYDFNRSEDESSALPTYS